MCRKKGVRHYPDHPKISSEITRNILIRLGYEEEYINKICYLVANHDFAIRQSEIDKDRELELKRLKIQKCDTLAHNPIEKEKREEYITKTLKLFK